MIIKKEITTTQEIKIETIKLENLLEMIVQQEDEKRTETYLFEIQKTDHFTFFIKIELKKEDVGIVKEEIETPEMDLANEMIQSTLEVDQLFGKPVIQTTQEDAEIGLTELSLAVLSKDTFYELEESKRYYNENLEPFIRTLQSKKCFSIEQLSKHDIKLEPVSKDALDPDIDINRFFKADSISYSLNEIFENRDKIEIISISRETNNNITLTFSNQSITFKGNLEKDDVSQFTEVIQKFLQLNQKEFCKYFELDQKWYNALLWLILHKQNIGVLYYDLIALRMSFKLIYYDLIYTKHLNCVINYDINVTNKSVIGYILWFIFTI